MSRSTAVSLLLGAWISCTSFGASMGGPADAWRIEEVRFVSRGLSLVGTLRISAHGVGPAPGVVILHGSGEEGRTFGPYVQQAEWFADLGFVVLDFDRPGIGGSEGTYEESPDLAHSAVDARAAVEFLRHRAEVDPLRVGVWGVSQGGWVGQIVAAEEQDLAFAVLVSAPGVSPLEQTLYQRGIDLLESGRFTAAEVESLLPLRRLLWRYYHSGEERGLLEASWAAARGAGWFVKMDWPEVPPQRSDLNPSQQAWFGAHCGYEPEPMLKRIRVPTLFLFGGKDRHIPVQQSLEATRAATMGNPKVEILLYPDAGHILQHVEGEGECMKCLREAHEQGRVPPIAPTPEALEATLRWLREKARVLG